MNILYCLLLIIAKFILYASITVVLIALAWVIYHKLIQICDDRKQRYKGFNGKYYSRKK